MGARCPGYARAQQALVADTKDGAHRRAPGQSAPRRAGRLRSHPAPQSRIREPASTALPWETDLPGAGARTQDSLSTCYALTLGNETKRAGVSAPEPKGSCPERRDDSVLYWGWLRWKLTPSTPWSKPSSLLHLGALWDQIHTLGVTLERPCPQATSAEQKLKVRLIKQD